MSAEKKRKKREEGASRSGLAAAAYGLAARPAFRGVGAPGAGQSNLFTVRALMVIFYDAV